MKNLFVIFLSLSPFFGWAQQSHTVGAKESLFSIGRKYDVHPRELAAYNNIPFETGLIIGQVLKIPNKKNMPPVVERVPVAKTTVVVSKPAATELPKGSYNVYHTVVKKEGLYGISKKYKVSIEEIKTWNNLNSDGLVEGMQLIVGRNGRTASTVVAVPEKKEAVAVAVPEAKPTVPTPVKETPKPARVEEVKKVNGGFNGGVFKSFYEAQVGNKNAAQTKGQAGIFKSTSGWEDGKYYCLHNTAAAGSYIKITNPVTQKSVYAKVLDLIPDLGENQGLIIRISNAAAAELGATTATFGCTVQF